MRLRLHPPAERLFRRLPRLTAYSAAEFVLLALIAVQAARLVWAVATPVGPVGDWRSPASPAPASDAALAEFDPFFRLSPGGPGVVSSLNLKLYGVREDRATGRGSAIIELPDGSQRSFAIAEEIVPGVTLAEVGFDNVTINRGGVREQLFLDQSRAPGAAPAGAPGATAPPPQTSSVAPVAPNAQIRFQERRRGGRFNGIAVGPGIDGGYALRAAGLVEGDVIVSINGQRIESLEQARAIARRARGEVSVIVNRGGRAVPLRMSLDL